MIVGSGRKFLATALLISFPFLWAGAAAAVLLGVVAVCAAHEAGHYLSAKRSGRSASILIDGWLPETKIEGGATRRMILAGPVASLLLSAAALAVLVALAVMTRIFPYAQAAAAEVGEWAAAVSALGVIDAVVNLTTVTFLCVGAAVLTVAASGWLASAPFIAAGAVCSGKGWRISDGDHLWADGGLRELISERARSRQT